MTTQWRPLWITQESIWQHGKTKSMARALEIRWMYWKRHDGPLKLACARNCPPFGTLNRKIGFPLSRHCFINTHTLSLSCTRFLLFSFYLFPNWISLTLVLTIYAYYNKTKRKIWWGNIIFLLLLEFCCLCFLWTCDYFFRNMPICLFIYLLNFIFSFLSVVFSLQLIKTVRTFRFISNLDDFHREH